MQFKASAVNCGCKNRHLDFKSNMNRKLNLLIFSILLGTLLIEASAQQVNVDLGDSLFQKKKYTEAFELYHTSFQNGEASPSMFLKMAFIKEGLGDYVHALFYLSRYYSLTTDKSVLVKMSELASENGLSGYHVGDAAFFETALLRFDSEIQLFLGGLSLLLLVLTLKSRKENLPIGLPIIQVVVLACLLIVSNDWVKEDRAIIEESTILMSGPSAAAEPIEQIKKGHQVEILEESEVWATIKMDDEIAYIRKSKLLKL